MSKLKVQNYLHELIKNLSQTEKRYFKLLAKQQTPGKKNDYIKLFEEIDKQDEFDEEKIKEKFKGTPIEKRYASLKKYLYELVIKSLTFYNSETIPSVRVRRMLDASEILQQKGLYHQAIRKLKKAEVMAEEAGMNHILHEIRELKMDCMLISEVEIDKTDFERFKSKQNAITESLQLSNKIKLKNNDLRFYGKQISGKEELNKNLKGFEEEIHDTNTKKLLFNTLSELHNLNNNSKKSDEYNSKSLELFESGELSKKQLPSEYISSLLTKLEGLSLEENALEIESLLSVCNEFFIDHNNSYYNKNNDYAHLLSLELNFALQSNDLLKINLISDKVKDYLDNKRNKLNPLTYRWLVYNLSWAEIKNKKFKSALIYSNELLTDKQITKSKTLYSPAIVQNIVIHYELRNFSYLEFAIKSFQKELKKHCEFTEAEGIVFDFFFNNLNKIGSSNVSNQVMFKLLSGQFELKVQENQNFASNLLLSWIKEKAGKLGAPVMS